MASIDGMVSSDYLPLTNIFFADLRQFLAGLEGTALQPCGHLFKLILNFGKGESAAELDELVEAAVDVCWEKLHTGYWKDVAESWRDAYSVACLFKAAHLLHSLEPYLGQVSSPLSLEELSTPISLPVHPSPKPTSSPYPVAPAQPLGPVSSPSSLPLAPFFGGVTRPSSPLPSHSVEAPSCPHIPGCITPDPATATVMTAATDPVTATVTLAANVAPDPATVTVGIAANMAPGPAAPGASQAQTLTQAQTSTSFLQHRLQAAAPPPFLSTCNAVSLTSALQQLDLAAIMGGPRFRQAIDQAISRVQEAKSMLVEETVEALEARGSVEMTTLGQVPPGRKEEAILTMLDVAPCPAEPSGKRRRLQLVPPSLNPISHSTAGTNLNAMQHSDPCNIAMDKRFYVIAQPMTLQHPAGAMTPCSGQMPVAAPPAAPPLSSPLPIPQAQVTPQHWNGAGTTNNTQIPSSGPPPVASSAPHTFQPVIPRPIHSLDAQPSIPLPVLSLGPPGTRIPEQHLPALERFLTGYMLEQQPVVVKGAIADWPALHRWADLDYLRRVAGCRTIPVEVGRHYLADGWGQQLMTLGDFLAQHIETGPGTAALRGYLAQHQLFEQIPALAQDIRTPEYCVLGRVNVQSINAWFGPPGTVTPLHTDPPHNLLAQVVGQKYVRLYAPCHNSHMRAHQDGIVTNSSTIDLDALSPTLASSRRADDYDRTEGDELWEGRALQGRRVKAANGLQQEQSVQEDRRAQEEGAGDGDGFLEVPFMDCILQPGDMLYIPPLWWHYVKSLTVSFSVSFWWQ